MSEIILKLINAKEDLIFLSKSYMRGEIIVNISKVAKKLGIDRKTASKYLKGFVPKKNRKRKKSVYPLRLFFVCLVFVFVSVR